MAGRSLFSAYTYLWECCKRYNLYLVIPPSSGLAANGYFIQSTSGYWKYIRKSELIEMTNNQVDQFVIEIVLEMCCGD